VALKNTWRGEHDARPHVVKMFDSFQIGDVFEDKRIVDGDLSSNFFIHGVNESL